MVEDYAIQMRIGRSRGTGHYEVNRRGNRKEITRYQEYYKTSIGEIEQEKWMILVREAIKQEEKEELLEEIKQHCREHCAWLRKESDLEIYAMECLTGGVYKHWDEFQKEIIWM